MAGSITQDLAAPEPSVDEGFQTDKVATIVGGHAVGVLPRRRLMWRHRPERLSRSNERYGQERFTACKALFLAESFLAGHDDFVLWGYGHTGRAICSAMERHGKRPRRR